MYETIGDPSMLRLIRWVVSSVWGKVVPKGEGSGEGGDTTRLLDTKRYINLKEVSILLQLSVVL